MVFISIKCITSDVKGQTSHIEHKGWLYMGIQGNDTSDEIEQSDITIKEVFEKRKN
jgi:hypothetical protein